MFRARSLVFAALVAALVPLTAGTVHAQPAPAPAAPAVPQPLPPEQALSVAQKVQAFYDQTASFRSDFTQEFYVKQHNIRKVSRGSVTFAKPGKMHWEYTDPKDNHVVSDGQKLQVYDANNKQMFEQNVDKSQYPAALSFLIGGGKLDQIFDFKLYDGKDMNFPGGQVLAGKPKVATPAYTDVLFYVDTATEQVRRVLIVDAQGNRNRFDFANPKVNVPVKDDTFKFAPPPGTQIVRP